MTVDNIEVEVKLEDGIKGKPAFIPCSILVCFCYW